MAIHTVKIPGRGILRFDTDQPEQRDAYEQLLAQANRFAKGRKESGPAEVAAFLASYTVDQLRTEALHAADAWLCEHVVIPDFSKESTELQRYRNMTPAEHARAQREADSAYAQQRQDAYSELYDDPNDGFTREQNESFEAYEARKREWRGGQVGGLFGERITLPPEE